MYLISTQWSCQVCYTGFYLIIISVIYILLECTLQYRMTAASRKFPHHQRLLNDINDKMFLSSVLCRHCHISWCLGYACALSRNRQFVFVVKSHVFSFHRHHNSPLFSDPSYHSVYNLNYYHQYRLLVNNNIVIAIFSLSLLFLFIFYI